MKTKVYHESIYILDNLEINISETLVREQIIFKRRRLKYLAFIFTSYWDADYANKLSVSIC